MQEVQPFRPDTAQDVLNDLQTILQNKNWRHQVKGASPVYGSMNYTQKPEQQLRYNNQLSVVML